MLKQIVSAKTFTIAKIIIKKWIYHLDMVKILLGYKQYFWFGQKPLFPIFPRAKVMGLVFCQTQND